MIVAAVKGMIRMSQGIRERALELAVSQYYWKPGVCLFRALELDAYLAANRHARSAVLDLGCGDGTVSAMLLEAGVIEGEIIGIDRSEEQLQKAGTLAHYQSLCLADAEELPFPDASFDSIVCNGVLEALPKTPSDALREAGRVLKRKGMLFLTVPTSGFMSTMLWPNLLGRFSRALADGYIRRLNRRLEHIGPERTAAGWVQCLKTGGFEVLYRQDFLSHSSGSAYNLLSMHIMRPLGLLKLVGSRPPAGMRATLSAMIRKVHGLDAKDERPGGYLLLVAQKS